MGVEVLWTTSNRAARRRNAAKERVADEAKNENLCMQERADNADGQAGAAHKTLYSKWWAEREESLLLPLQGLLGRTVDAIVSFLDKVGAGDATNAGGKVPGAIVSSAGAAAVDHHRLLIPRALNELRSAEMVVIRCRSCDIQTLEDIVSVAVRQIHSQMGSGSSNGSSAVASILKQVRDWAEFWQWLGAAAASAAMGFDRQQPLVFLLEDAEAFPASILDDLVRVLGEAFSPGPALVPVAVVMFTAQTVATLEDQLFSTTISRLDVEEIVAPLGTEALHHWFKALALGCATFPLSLGSKTLCSIMRAYHDGFQTLSAAMHVLSLTSAAHFHSISNGDEETRDVLKFLIENSNVGVDDLALLEKKNHKMVGIQKSLSRLWHRNFGVLVLVELITQLSEEACELAKAGNDSSGGKEAPGLHILVCSLFAPGYLDSSTGESLLADATSNFRYIAQVRGAKGASVTCRNAVERSQAYSQSLIERERSGFLQYLLDSDKSLKIIKNHIGNMATGNLKNTQDDSGYTAKTSSATVSPMMPLRNRVSSRAMEAALSVSNRESRQNRSASNGNSAPKLTALEDFNRVLDTLYDMIEGVSGSNTKRFQIALQLGGMEEDTVVEKVHSQIFPSPQKVLRQQLELGQLSSTTRTSDSYKTSFGNVGDSTVLYNIMKQQSNVVCLKTTFQEFVRSHQNATEKRGTKRRRQDTDSLQVRFFGALFELQHIGLLSRSRKLDCVKMLSLDY